MDAAACQRTRPGQNSTFNLVFSNFNPSTLSPLIITSCGCWRGFHVPEIDYDLLWLLRGFHVPEIDYDLLWLLRGFHVHEIDYNLFVTMLPCKNSPLLTILLVYKVTVMISVSLYV